MRKLRQKRFGFILALGALALAIVAIPAAAVAQDASSDPSAAQYTPTIPDGDDGETASGGSTGGSSGGGGGGGGLDSQIGSLPFTGMDLIILAGVALVLTGTGFALRRLSMPRGPRF
jgi:hypothetical protein